MAAPKIPKKGRDELTQQLKRVHENVMEKLFAELQNAHTDEEWNKIMPVIVDHIQSAEEYKRFLNVLISKAPNELLNFGAIQHAVLNKIQQAEKVKDQKGAMGRLRTDAKDAREFLSSFKDFIKDLNDLVRKTNVPEPKAINIDHPVTRQKPVLASQTFKEVAKSSGDFKAVKAFLENEQNRRACGIESFVMDGTNIHLGVKTPNGIQKILVLPVEDGKIGYAVNKQLLNGNQSDNVLKSICNVMVRTLESDSKFTFSSAVKDKEEKLKGYIKGAEKDGPYLPRKKEETHLKVKFNKPK